MKLMDNKDYIYSIHILKSDYTLISEKLNFFSRNRP
jgi:hypothetical protein